MGFDLIFLVLKSVSMLFGFGDVQLCNLVRKVHDVVVCEVV